MRALMIGCTLALVGAGPWPGSPAETAKDAKAAPAASEVRYFNALGDLLGDLPVDAFIKETRQGGKLVASTLDVCYSVSTASDRKDRFVLDLKVEGEKLSGSGQSIENKTPVTVSLTRKGSKSASFDGKITVGSHLTSVSSPDNADVDEKEFQQSQVVDDDLSETPKDFTQVSPAIGGRPGQARKFRSSRQESQGPERPDRSRQHCDRLQRAALWPSGIASLRRSRTRAGSDRDPEDCSRRGRGGLDLRHLRYGARRSVSPPVTGARAAS